MPRITPRPRAASICSISDADRDPGLAYLATTYNGIDPAQWTFRAEPGEDLVFLARFHPEKGAHLAIAIAKKAGVRLKMAAIPQDEAYFKELVEPHIDGDQIQFLGHVKGTARDELLGTALALVHMTTRPERFGLTMIEAMACGTPVLGADMGSIPEIVVDGTTGYLCRDVDEAAAHVPQLAQLSRHACRRHVETAFSTERMIDRYCDAYTEALRLRLPIPATESQQTWRAHDWWDRPMALYRHPREAGTFRLHAIGRSSARLSLSAILGDECVVLGWAALHCSQLRRPTDLSLAENAARGGFSTASRFRRTRTRKMRSSDCPKRRFRLFSIFQRAFLYCAAPGAHAKYRYERYPIHHRAVLTTGVADEPVAIAQRVVPVAQPGEALVRVAAVSLNPGEVRRARKRAAGEPIGWDFAGVVETAAADGSGPKAGARVVGYVASGAWADYVAAPTKQLAPIPDTLAFADAATLPIAGLTALRTLRRGGDLRGKAVLIVPGTGGVGLFALQLAKRAGARVATVIRSERNEALVRAYGAETVVVGPTADAAPHGPYDLILDSLGGDSLAAALGMVATDGTVVILAKLRERRRRLPPMPFTPRAVRRSTGSSSFTKPRRSRRPATSSSSPRSRAAANSRRRSM